MGKVQVNPYATGTGPYPNFRRAMVFIDGENLVFRYQDAIKQGKIPKNNISHKSDVYVWSPDSINIDGLYEIERAILYTYESGGTEAVDVTSNIIKKLKYTTHLGSQLPEYLFPKVFRKKKGANGKGVDIQLTVDVLTHAYRNNYDILYLISGDGDFKPLIEEVIRTGKQVYVAALSSGLNPSLKLAADVFIDLDQSYFKS